MSLESQGRNHMQRSGLRQKEYSLVKHSPNNIVSSEILFTSDRKGDEQNVQYGSLDQNKVPRYRTSGYGRLLGLGSRYRIVSTSNTLREVNDDANDTTRKGRDMLSLVASRPLGDSDRESSTKIAVAEDLDFSNQRDFVRLGSKQIRKRRKLSPSQTDHEALLEPLSVEDSDSSALISDLDSDSDFEKKPVETPDGDAFERFRNHPDNKKQIELLRKTEQDPENVEAWLALIDHQDNFYLLSLPSHTNSLSSSAKRAVTDIKISFYERALKAVRNAQSREKLLLGYLQEGSGLWDTKKHLNEWRIALRRAPSLSLWYQFLDFQQSNAMMFTYDSCLETYTRAFGLVHAITTPEDHDFHFAYTLLRQTTFMHQAGYSERAIAIWQASIEYNFFGPLSVDDTEAQTAFELFWDTEVARVGEEHARGWSEEAGQEVKQQSDPLLPQCHNLDHWAESEIARSESDIMPARTLDDTVEDDPYRVIIASDIKAFLTTLKTERGKRMLIEAFLKFCGLPQSDKELTECCRWWCDPFLSDYHSRTDTAESASSLRTDVMSHFVVDTTTLFPTSGWFSAWYGSASAGKLIEFATRSCAQLAHVHSQNPCLAEYVIALKTHYNPGSARKFAKGSLKKRPDSLILYNAYALTEVRSNKFDLAMNVWSTALSMASSLGPDSQEQSVVLWHTQIWELLRKDHKDSALYILVKAMHNIEAESQPNPIHTEKYSSGDYLKAETLLRNRIADTIDSRHSDELVVCTDMLAILKYLSSGQNIDEAFSVYQSTILAISSNQYITTELLHQFQARLIHYHATHSPSGYRPAQLIPFLKASYLAFPENSIIHNMYHHYSRQAGAMDRIRDLDLITSSSSSSKTANLSRNSDDKDQHRIASIIPSLLKIDRELHRPIYAGSTAHSIRTAFTQATSNPDGPALHNPQTWLSWLNWELSSQVLPSSASSSVTSNNPSAGAAKRSSISDPNRTITTAAAATQKRIKEIYLSSLRACPWCKELYLFGFQHQSLREAIGTKGLVEIYRGMVERGLRVRIDISELIEDMEG